MDQPFIFKIHFVPNTSLDRIKLVVKLVFETRPQNEDRCYNK